MDCCPKCGNRLGFAFGCCCQCGYNYISKQYDWIKVWKSDLKMTDITFDDEYILTMKHNKSVTRFNES